MAVIYLTTNLINFKIYSGFDSKNNSKYLGSGTYLKIAIEKCGKENFKKEILEEFDLDDWSLGRWQDRERYWIHFYNSQNPEIGYNITEGGQGTFGYLGNIGSKRNKKTKLKQSIAAALAHKNNPTAWNGHIPYMKNKHHSLKTRVTMSIKGKGKLKTKSHARNISNGLTLALKDTVWIYDKISEKYKRPKIKDLQNWIDLGWVKKHP